MIRFYRIGLPHSEISGSKLVCSSPKLIAACHALHRLSAPRHPPFTLCSLTKISKYKNITLQNKDAVSLYPVSIFSKNILVKPDFYHQCRRPGSNRRPSPCKGDALPAELLPQQSFSNILLVGLARVELATSRLSGVRSNQLSYRPILAATSTQCVLAIK